MEGLVCIARAKIINMGASKYMLCPGVLKDRLIKDEIEFVKIYQAPGELNLYVLEVEHEG